MILFFKYKIDKNFYKNGKTDIFKNKNVKSATRFVESNSNNGRLSYKRPVVL